MRTIAEMNEKKDDLWKTNKNYPPIFDKKVNFSKVNKEELKKDDDESLDAHFLLKLKNN